MSRINELSLTSLQELLAFLIENEDKKMNYTEIARKLEGNFTYIYYQKGFLLENGLATETSDGRQRNIKLTENGIKAATACKVLKDVRNEIRNNTNNSNNTTIPIDSNNS